MSASVKTERAGLMGDICPVINSVNNACRQPERDFFMDNLLVRIHFIIGMIWWTGLAPQLHFIRAIETFVGPAVGTYKIPMDFEEQSFRRGE